MTMRCSMPPYRAVVAVLAYGGSPSADGSCFERMDPLTSSSSNAEPWFAGAGEPPRGKVRCSCRYCGAHVVAQAGYRIGGQCMNCGSFDLAVLAERERSSQPGASSAQPQ